MVKTAFAILVSLLLAGNVAGAQPDEPSRAAAEQPGVIRLFGKNMCLSTAPLDARCDWRLSQPTPRPDETKSFLFFGKRWCTFDADGPCDFRLPPPAGKARTTALRLFGMNWCFGAVSPESTCDVKLPPAPDDGAQARL